MAERITRDIDLDCSISKVITEMDKDLHPMYMLGASVLLLQAKDHKSFQVTNYNANLHRSLHLIAKLPSIIGVFMNDDTKFTKDKKFDSYAQYCLYVFNQKLAMETKWVKIFEKILILHADHTMNNSTFSVRAVGSSQASIYASIASAINSLSGPLHGGANESVMMMLKEIGSPDNVLNYVDNKLDNKEKIMGIGHRVYKTYDPRSLFIKNNILPLIFGQDSIIEVDNELKKLYDIAIKVEEVVIDRLAGKNIYPNVDFWSGLVLQAMGIEAKYFTTIFALGRIMGWVSHWVEHMEAKNRIFRPNQLYDGIGTRHIIIDSKEEIVPKQ